MIIQKAESGDLLEVSKMYRDMVVEAESGRYIKPLSAFYEVCEKWIKSPLHYVFITKYLKATTGLLICEIDDLDGLAGRQLLVSAAYVKPRFRGSKSIVLLMNIADKLGAELNLDLVTFATIDSASLSVKLGAEPKFIKLIKKGNGAL